MGGHCTTVCSPPHPILPASCLLQEEAEQQVQQQPDGPQRHGSPVQRRHSSAAGLGRGGSSPDPLGDLLEMEPVPPNNTDWEREVGLDMPECASKPTCKPLHTRVCVCARVCACVCVSCCGLCDNQLAARAHWQCACMHVDLFSMSGLTDCVCMHVGLLNVCGLTDQVSGLGYLRISNHSRIQILPNHSTYCNTSIRSFKRPPPQNGLYKTPCTMFCTL